MEIENAELRHEWAKAEIRRAGSSRAMVRFVAESTIWFNNKENVAGHK
jgi:hypothetical protein